MTVILLETGKQEEVYYGYFIYFCRIPIAWKSNGMRSIVPSTTEAEYIALSEEVKEIKFILQLMSTMNVKVEIQSQFTLTMWVQYGCQTTEQQVKEQSMYT